ncbi:MAPEG family protein [Erythrobacter arachoides]|uniref:MAPEG family protein n=1 Tax=Aurantiacibacter arachoides TaxID=1850444 RepID=A0A844ZZ12_9SPHN|nr:MAPEG family protein [Aurantiacibacter arachoides]MXO92948.1 MAPEG family protein [Aurantiacibacter arachoides]
MDTVILVPAAVLVLWTLIMLVWMIVLRLPALAKLGRTKEQMRGGRGQDLDKVLPGTLQWKAHNYIHLLEQPTLFYAVTIMFALVGASEGDVLLAWAYVAIRVIHSLWQAVVNTIPVRFALFALSTLVLLAMTVKLLLALLAIA